MPRLLSELAWGTGTGIDVAPIVVPDGWADRFFVFGSCCSFVDRLLCVLRVLLSFVLCVLDVAMSGGGGAIEVADFLS